MIGASHRKDHDQLVHDIIVAASASGQAVLYANQSGYDPRARRKCGGCPGFPDIYGWNKLGLFFGLEVKTGMGRLSPVQKIWHDMARRTGACVAVVRSVEEAMAFLRVPVLRVRAK